MSIISNRNGYYTLNVLYDGRFTTLAGNVEIQDIPVQPYAFSTESIQFDMDLVMDWNLISLPILSEDTDPGAVLASIDGKYNSVWAYNPDTGWAIYNPGGVSDLQEMKPGYGYWIKADQNCWWNVNH